MSKISISAASPTTDKSACAFLRKRLGLALSSVVKRLGMGREGIFYTTELYLNDHVEKSQEIRDIIDWFNERDIALFIMEIPYDLEWENVIDWSEYRIPDETLLNTLDEAADEFS